MNQKKDNFPEHDLRDSFLEDLNALYSPPEVDWDVMDRAVMGQAHRILLQRRRRWIYWPTAAAAVILIAAGLLLMQYQPEKPPLAGIAAEDVDQNGRVDILDAFKLAKMVQSATVPEGRWDMNHDGAVNQQDVDIVAQAAVTVQKEML